MQSRDSCAFPDHQPCTFFYEPCISDVGQKSSPDCGISSGPFPRCSQGDGGKVAFRVTLVSAGDNQCCLGERRGATAHSRDVMKKALRGMVSVVLVLDCNWDQKSL